MPHIVACPLSKAIRRAGPSPAGLAETEAGDHLRHVLSEKQLEAPPRTEAENMPHTELVKFAAP